MKLTHTKPVFGDERTTSSFLWLPKLTRNNFEGHISTDLRWLEFATYTQLFVDYPWRRWTTTNFIYDCHDNFNREIRIATIILSIVAVCAALFILSATG